MKKNWILVLLLILVLASSCVSTQKTQAIDSTTTTVFSYIHDPRLDQKAMEDIKEDPSAIYGFSPREDSSRLSSFASYDWSDPALIESAKAERQAYHESIEDLFIELAKLLEDGNDIETCARVISTLRNQARLDAYKNNPEALQSAKDANLQKYGNEFGPTPESLFEKYGSWQIVLQKAFSSNHGMDACLGLYDEQYEHYVLLGEI